jgi:hypothetical protein
MFHLSPFRVPSVTDTDVEGEEQELRRQESHREDTEPLGYSVLTIYLISRLVCQLGVNYGVSDVSDRVSGS